MKQPSTESSIWLFKWWTKIHYITFQLISILIDVQSRTRSAVKISKLIQDKSIFSFIFDRFCDIWLTTTCVFWYSLLNWRSNGNKIMFISYLKADYHLTEGKYTSKMTERPQQVKRMKRGHYLFKIILFQSWRSQL